MYILLCDTVEKNKNKNGVYRLLTEHHIRIVLSILFVVELFTDATVVVHTCIIYKQQINISVLHKHLEFCRASRRQSRKF